MVQIVSEPQEDRILQCVGERIAFSSERHARKSVHGRRLGAQ